MERLFRFRIPSLILLVAVFGLSWAQAPRVMVLKATAYTSSVRETDSTPFITATGARTRIGIIAVSRDMLKVLPYGSKVMLEDLGTPNGTGKGRFNYLFKDRVFIVEDTMHPRKRERIDVWLPDRSTAIRFGVRNVRVTVIQRGRG
ncbi:3D domain-containing protein [Meiothermus rufus]|uniref:3D domain-containing protein n=1 Tax=Meiothermus rufus TaxID=604332 RepID=UPI000402C675|nr:3D domain-containing protein [Meiothermus rufus]